METNLPDQLGIVWNPSLVPDDTSGTEAEFESVLERSQMHTLDEPTTVTIDGVEYQVVEAPRSSSGDNGHNYPSFMNMDALRPARVDIPSQFA